VHEHNRIALAFVEIGDLDSAVMKTRHPTIPFVVNENTAQAPLLAVEGLGKGLQSIKFIRLRRQSPSPAEARPPSVFANRRAFL